MEDQRKLLDAFSENWSKLEMLNSICKQIIEDNDLQKLLYSIDDLLKDFTDEMLQHYIRLSIWQAVAESIKQRAKDLLGSDS